MLAVHAKRVAARHQELQRGGAAEQRGEGRSRLVDLLEVVDEEQRRAVVQVPRYLVECRSAPRLHTKGACDLVRNESGSRERGQSDEDDTVIEASATRAPPAARRGSFPVPRGP